MRKALMEYLPQVLRDTAEFQQIMSVEQESADRFFEALDSEAIFCVQENFLMIPKKRIISPKKK